MGTIREEIRQTRPFDSAADEAVVTLLATADRVHGRLAAVLDRQEITLQQYNVLRILRGAGAEGLPTLEIGGRMIERTPGVTRLLDRLEQKGLVSRERTAADRRQVICRITAAGLGLLRRLDRPVDLLEEEIFAALDDREVGDLVSLLDKVRLHNTRGR